MRMGALATIGYQRPANLVHILLDNRSTSRLADRRPCRPRSTCVALPPTAAIHRWRAETPDELAGFLSTAGNELSFLHVPIQTGVAEPLPRPAIEPPAVAQRLC